ncbi:MAG: hypothetical protein OXC25_03530 [Thiotrichales bacterium]|nr:hypothetical protein [Thiotrichales bacterium]
MKHAIHRVSALVGGFLVIGAMALFSSQAAVAFGVGFSGGDIRGEPTKYRRHVLCNEAWRASPAVERQGCQLLSVHWDSYRNDLPFGYGDVFGETSHMMISMCWVHAKCVGPYWWQTARRNGKVPYPEVFDLARCKNDPKTVQPGCEPVTDAQLRAWNFLRPHTHPKYAD